MKEAILFIAACALCIGATAATFKGYQCTQDCSGHKAGYAWAKRKGVTDLSQCSGNSQSFVEGCLAFAEGK